MSLSDLVKELLFPEKCILCGRVLRPGETDFCGECRASAPEYDEKRRLPGIDSVTAVWFYENKVRDSLIRFKFHHKPGYAAGFGRMMAMKAARQPSQADFVAWVPVSAKRRWERGYDQGQLLAQAVSRELWLEAKPVLKKIRDNPAQSGIESMEQRYANVKDAYRVTDPEAVTGKRILLIDDILTTGATSSECARMLRSAGAESIHLLVAASGRKHKKTNLAPGYSGESNE